MSRPRDEADETVEPEDEAVRDESQGDAFPDGLTGLMMGEAEQTLGSEAPRPPSSDAPRGE
jgi:hypothetical protein